MNKEQLERLKELESEATKGQWIRIGPYSKGGWLDSGFVIAAPDHAPDLESNDDGNRPLWCNGHGIDEHNSALLVALRNAAPVLIARAEWAERAKVALEQWNALRHACWSCEGEDSPSHREGRCMHNQGYLSNLSNDVEKEFLAVIAAYPGE